MTDSPTGQNGRCNMIYRRLVLALALLVLALLGVAALSGCVKTPDGLKMAEKTEHVADKTAAIVEVAVEQASPYAHLVPYGSAAIALLGGIAATYLKVRPYIVATTELVARVQMLKNGVGVSMDTTEEVRDAFLSNTATTKKVVAKIKKTL